MLGFLKLKHNFIIDFFNKKTIYSFYDRVYNKTNGQFFLNPKTVTSDFGNRIYVVNNIPPYFDLRINTDNVSYDFFTTNHTTGFLVNLKGYTSIAGYLKDQFGAKSRSKMRAYLKRLETCFSIRYNMFHGDISKKDYDFLFDQFLVMIKRRFSQRKETHEALKDWDYIRKTTYSRILRKEVSLFVIYDGNKPIDICLSYIHQNIFNNSIRSYDIDYSKFRLGHIDILKQLEWCLENDYTIFDLSIGDMDYKRKWCNTIYEFEHQVLFPKKLIHKKFLAAIIKQLICLKSFMKEKRVDVLYHKVKSTFKKKKKEKVKEDKEFCLKKIPISEALLSKKTVNIDINQEDYSFLRQEVYDFQYKHSALSTDLSIQKLINCKNTFIVSYKNDYIVLINQKINTTKNNGLLQSG